MEPLPQKDEKNARTPQMGLLISLGREWNALSITGRECASFFVAIVGQLLNEIKDELRRRFAARTVK